MPTSERTLGNPEEAAGLPVVRSATREAKVGEWSWRSVSPFGFDNTVTAGIVSAKGRSLPQENFVPFIQTDVAINPGNSGGPLFNMRGEVVAINSQIYSRTGGFMGLSFAIPIDVALDVQKQLRDKGRVSRGRMGVVIQEVTRDIATSFGLDRARGALVNSVRRAAPTRPASRRATSSLSSTASRSKSQATCAHRRATRPGAKVDLEVLRKGSTRSLPFVAASCRRSALRRAIHRANKRKPVEVAANRLGLVLNELTAEQKKEQRLSHGLVVTEVKQDARAELRRGDILLTLVHKGKHAELRSVEQFNQLLGGLDKSAVITLHVKRGETTAFVTVTGLADKG